MSDPEPCKMEQEDTEEQRRHTGEKMEETGHSILSFDGVKNHMCSDCGKTFMRDAELKLHQRIHTGEKPYKCSHCDKRFAQFGSWKRHERTHTGEKPYYCFSCGKSFTQSSSLLRHTRNICLKSH
uniref:C2H2-type domain-containing protein n=1 Tax=Cyprinus carpio TaxID=7962 RepID=A0A8C1P8A6_CYPCA